jgi:transposase
MSERFKYRQLKKARWPLLTNQDHLQPSQKDALDDIISTHEAVAICYAMKEEMIKLYAITDYNEAVEGWKRWFKAAKESEIPALVRFAKLKEKRIDGLANHARYPINTGRLEGYNNKIKVAKRRA